MHFISKFTYVTHLATFQTYYLLSDVKTCWFNMPLKNWDESSSESCCNIKVRACGRKSKRNCMQEMLGLSDDLNSLEMCAKAASKVAQDCWENVRSNTKEGRKKRQHCENGYGRVSSSDSDRRPRVNALVGRKKEKWEKCSAKTKRISCRESTSDEKEALNCLH